MCSIPRFHLTETESALLNKQMSIVIPVKNEMILLSSQCCITNSEFWLSPNPTLIPAFDSGRSCSALYFCCYNLSSACSAQATLSLWSRAACVSGLLGMELKSACISAADFLCCVKVLIFTPYVL